MSNTVVSHCKVCKKMTPHYQPATSHVLHFLLSLVTVGFWLPIWLLMTLNNRSQGQCAVCGRREGVFGSGSGGVAQGPTAQTHVLCPDCRAPVPREARVCMHCGCKLVPQ